jgi:hypothetical protein
MKFSRSSRWIAACLALIGMLFMQLAVASYVCPGTASGDISISASAAPSMPQNMPGCDGMDHAQPSLCHASAHPHGQSLDTPQLPSVQPFMAAHVVIIPLPTAWTSFSEASLAPSGLLKRTTAPPITIRNCCFRI